METKEYPKPVTLTAANRALSAALRERDSLLSVQKQLVEALEETIDHLRMFYQARWSEYEGTEQYLIGNARAAILAAKAAS